MSRSEIQQTGEDYYKENVFGSWQFGVPRGEISVIQSIRPIHIQIIAAGLAVAWNKTVCGIEDINGREWIITPEDGAELLQKDVSEIIRSGGVEPKMV